MENVYLDISIGGLPAKRIVIQVSTVSFHITLNFLVTNKIWGIKIVVYKINLVLR